MGGVASMFLQHSLVSEQVPAPGYRVPRTPKKCQCPVPSDYTP